MQSREFRELAGMVALTTINPEDFVGFGMKGSHVYRRLFLSLTKNMNKVDRTWVIILATAVKNRERILS